MNRAFVVVMLVAGATLGIGLLGAPSPAQAGPCFDRCMTRCHLPIGYAYCRNRCTNMCWRGSGKEL